MKVSIHSNKKISLHCTIDNNAKDFFINRKRTMIFSDNIKEIRFSQNNPNQNTNVFGFIFLAVIIAFLETQKTFEKRDFISLYDFADECLVCNFSFYPNGENDINIFSKTKEFPKFNYVYWCCENKNVKITNEPELKILKEKLKELIAFWSVVIFIPLVILSVVTLTVFFKTGNVFEIGIVLMAFLVLLFIFNVLTFFIQYKTIIESVRSID